MVFPIFKVLAGFSVVLGTGGAGLAGTYALTKKTILDGLENKRPVSTKNGEADTAWTKLVKKLKSNGDNNPKSNNFEKVKNETSLDTDTSKLKPACEKVSEEIYSTIFYKDDDLLNDFKKFCVISLGDMLGNDKMFSSDTNDLESPKTSEKSKLKEKLTNLQTHTDGGNNGNLDEELKGFKKDPKSNIPENDERIAKLFKWCKKHYESSYVSDSDNLKKLVYKYCDKS